VSIRAFLVDIIRWRARTEEDRGMMGRRGIGFMEMIEGNIGWRMGLRSGTAGYALRVCVRMCGWIKNYGLGTWIEGLNWAF